MVRMLQVYSFIVCLFMISCKEKSTTDIALEFHKKGQLNGAVIVVKDGQIICDTVLGYANFEEQVFLSQNTAFYIASLTKPITAIGIMLLEQEGAVAYDDKASQYVENLPAYAQNISIYQLLTHTSGLVDYEEVLSLTQHRLTNEDVMQFLNEQTTLEFLGGSQFKYSNSGYVVLSEIIKSVSGMAYSEFIQSKIFNPLKMEHSFVYTQGITNLPERAIGYNQQKMRDDYAWATTGDGGIYATTRDLYKLDQALRNNVLLTSENTVRMYQVPSLKNGEKSEYALGWFIKDHVAEHTGGLNGFRSLFWRDLKRDSCIIVLTNQGDAFPIYAFLNQEIEKLYDRNQGKEIN